MSVIGANVNLLDPSRVYGTGANVASQGTQELRPDRVVLRVSAGEMGTYDNPNLSLEGMKNAAKARQIVRDWHEKKSDKETPAKFAPAMQGDDVAEARQSGQEAPDAADVAPLPPSAQDEIDTARLMAQVAMKAAQSEAEIIMGRVFNTETANDPVMQQVLQGSLRQAIQTAKALIRRDAQLEEMKAVVGRFDVLIGLTQVTGNRRSSGASPYETQVGAGADTRDAKSVNRMA